MRGTFNPAIELPFSPVLGVNQNTTGFSVQTHRQYKNKSREQIGKLGGLGLG